MSTHDDKTTITLHFTGHLTIDGEPLLSRLRAQRGEPTLGLQAGPFREAPARLAYSMRETADLLGVSYITVHRLLKRGLLKSSQALRHKIIPRTEIERFLKDSMRSI
jgi:excisionase family DNA binding protein